MPRDYDTKLVDDSKKGFKHCYTIEMLTSGIHFAHGYTKKEAAINWLEEQIAEIKNSDDSWPLYLEKDRTWNEDAWKRGQETLRKKREARREAKKKLAS